MQAPPESPLLSRRATWIDANMPFCGVYENEKNTKWKDDPDPRPEPQTCQRRQRGVIPAEDRTWQTTPHKRPTTG